MKCAALGLILFLLPAAAASADELRLKDGSKIVGTVVGFEDNSFKVQTSYGYALVRKEMVVAVFVTDTKSESASEKPAEKPKEKKVATPKAPAPPSTAPAAQAAAKAAAPPAAPPTKEKSAIAATSPAAPLPAPATTPVAKPAPAAAAQPAAAPAPEPMRESVEGNAYVNLTYGFRMYKPPSWHVIEDARKTLATAVVAMGTADETTLLVVGREPLRGSLEASADATMHELGDTYENLRLIGEEKITVSGSAALERRFRGTVDEHDWSGRVVWLARGNHVFTLMGLTYADSDPVLQVRENVIARAIDSLQFNQK